MKHVPLSHLSRATGGLVLLVGSRFALFLAAALVSALPLHVPFGEAVRLMEALTRAGKPYDVVVFPEGHHIIQGPYWWGRVTGYLMEHLASVGVAQELSNERSARAQTLAFSPITVIDVREAWPART